jgi:hypothetical protein
MKSRRTIAKRTNNRPKRSPLHPISEEMLQWSALLEAELIRWPRVIAKPMFGFRSFYRGRTMFAAVPRSREFDPRNSLIMKFNAMTPPLLQRMESDPRLGSWSREYGRGWFTFTLKSGEDLRDALWWLNQSYETAGKKKPKLKRKSRA